MAFILSLILHFFATSKPHMNGITISIEEVLSIEIYLHTFPVWSDKKNRIAYLILMPRKLFSIQWCLFFHFVFFSSSFGIFLVFNRISAMHKCNLSIFHAIFDSIYSFFLFAFCLFSHFIRWCVEINMKKTFNLIILNWCNAELRLKSSKDSTVSSCCQFKMIVSNWRAKDLVLHKQRAIFSMTNFVKALDLESLHIETFCFCSHSDTLFQI